MYCNKCNQYNHDDAAFCAFCGSAMTQQPATEQPSAAPVYTPDQSTPGYDNPSWQQPVYQQTPEQQNNGYYTAQPMQPKKKFRKALLIVPVALVCVVLVGYLIMHLIIASSPQYQVIDGITNTLEEFEGSLESADTFHEIYENVYECITDKEFSAEIRIQSDYDVDARLSFDYSQPEEFVSLGADIEADYRDYNFDLAANQKKLMLRFDQLSDNVYSIPLKNFGKEFQDSNLADVLGDQFTYAADYRELERTLEKLSIDLFADTSFDAFRDAYDDFDDWITDLDIKEVDYNIPHTRDLTVYRAAIDGGELARIFVKYLNFQYEQVLGENIANKLDFDDLYDDIYYELDDQEIIVYFGINDDDCLTAFYGYEEGDEDNSISVVLSGSRNIWDECTFYEGNEEVGGFSIDETSKGFVAEFYDINYDGERDVELTVVCNEDAGELIISDGYDEFVVNFSHEDESSVFSFGDKYDDVRITVSISPFEGTKFPEGKELSLMDFTLSDFEDLGRDIEYLID